MSNENTGEKGYRAPFRHNHPLMILKVELSRLAGTVLIIVGGNILNSIFPGLKTTCLILGILFFIGYGYFQHKEGLKGGFEHKLWRLGLTKIDKYNFDPAKDNEFYS